MGANLAIGATVDVGAINDGMASVQEITRTAANGMAVSFEQASTKAKAAFRGLSEDVKASALNISKESLRVAEATKAQAAAMQDLRRAMILTRDGAMGGVQSSALLAAAQQKVTAAAAEVAAAKQAEAASVTQAAAEEVVATTGVLAAFERLTAGVSEATTVVKERMIEAAETAKLSGAGMTAGFAGLGSLLGAGMTVGFATHFLDELAKVNVELDHLATKTGIAVGPLAGLQQIVKEMGGDWDAVATGLVKLNVARVEAATGNKKTAEGFHEIGVSIEEVRNSRPQELLEKVAAGMASTGDAATRAHAARLLFGRGGMALIPVLMEEGAALADDTRKAAELTGITEESIEASRRWTQDTARLSAEFRHGMIPVLEHAEDAVMGIVGTLHLAEATFRTVFEGIATIIVANARALGGVGKLFYDAITGNFSAIQADTAALKDNFVDTWKAGFKDIASDWQGVYKNFVPDARPERKKIENTLDSDLHPEDKGRKEKTARAARAGKEPPRIETTQPKVNSDVDEFIQAGEREIRANEEVARRGVEIYRGAREEEGRIAQENYRDLEADSAFEVKMHRMTAEQRLAILRQAAQQEFQIRMQALQAEAVLDVADGARYQQDLNKQLELRRQHDRQMLQLDQQLQQQQQQMQDQQQKKWQQSFQQINAGFRNVLQGMMQGTQSLAQGFARMFNSILTGLADFVLQWLLKKAEMWVMDEVLEVSGRARKHAAVAASNAATVTGDAGVAAAGAMAYWSAINPPIAPAMAAAQAAMTLAYMPMAMFDRGGVVTAGGGMHVPVLAKAGERVLTPTQTQNFESLVNQSSSSQHKSTTVNLHYNGQVNAYDRSGMRGTLRAHADDILSIVREGYRAGALA
ncbi:MAG TPA: hypothetical protein VM554_12855 [Acidisarcina sp.]|nr:hypothetical protein [Acidisarcina sp.]